jgi:hypothetical protein
MAKAKVKASPVNEWADLEIFTSKGAKLGKSIINILENSTILFNAGFVHTGKVRDYTHVILGYSSIKKAITFQFTADEKAEGTIPLQKGSGSSIGSKAFFTYFALNLEEIAGKYEPKKEKVGKIGDLWFIDLSKKLPD